MSTQEPNSLLITRKKLDRIDQEIVQAISERLNCAKELFAIKQQRGDELRDEEREAEVIHNIITESQSLGLNTKDMEQLFRQIIDLSLSVQKNQEKTASIPSSLRSEDPIRIHTPSPSKGASKDYHLAARSGHDARNIVHVGTLAFGGKAKPVVIAGPCAVESRDQIMTIAAELQAQGVHMMRGGCFKPRTSPYSFQGLRYEGLALLKEAGERYGLPIVTEVMEPGDVAQVAEYADMLQIGARNMQNFPLLRAVGRCKRAVLLKRGFMSTIEEWLSAAEYILELGNSSVVLCERGIRTFETATRNTLDISAVPVIREKSHLPIIIDPSHASGNWRYIPDLSAAALGVGADGIMLEVHPHPEQALSDGPQALTFPVFRTLMRRLAPYLEGKLGKNWAEEHAQ